MKLGQTVSTAENNMLVYVLLDFKLDVTKYFLKNLPTGM